MSESYAFIIDISDVEVFRLAISLFISPSFIVGYGITGYIFYATYAAALLANYMHSDFTFSMSLTIS